MYHPGEWLSDFEIAKQIAGRTQKNMLVYFINAKCIFCKKFDSEVLSRSKFRQYAAGHLVLFKAEMALTKADRKKLGGHNQALVKYYNVTGAPTVLLLDSKGVDIRRQSGSVGEKQFFERLFKIR